MGLNRDNSELHDDPAAEGRGGPPLAAGPANETLRGGQRPSSARLGRPSWLVSAALRLLAAFIVLAFGWFATMMVYYWIKFPDPMAATSKAPIIRILARDGSLIAERGAAHPYMPLELIPPHVVEAVVAIEDRRFYEHTGVDVSGLMRAALANLRAGRYAQGGSTLTQQLAKNMYLSPERTLLRKLEELSLAVWLELRLEKREILELYLNQVYFGSGAYGIEAAAQRHFGKSARALSVVEGAIVAGLLKAPSRYAPSNDPIAARRRGRVVLNAMGEAGYLSPDQLREALTRPVRFRRDSQAEAAPTDVGYPVDLVLERMPALLSADEGEILVETSIDLDLQREATAALADTLLGEGSSRAVTQGAVVVLDESGGIRAIVGGRDYLASQFNRAIRASRQPGSTFKPFVFLAALEAGRIPETSMVDRPLSIGGWSPRNADGRFRGEISLREALAQSVNTVAVRLADELTPRRVAGVARRAGITAELRADPSLALGTSEVSLVELTGAYALFSNGGRKVEPHIIRRIRNVSGRVLYADAGSATESVFDLRHIGHMNDMLNAALVAGTGRKAALAGHPAAGKTGTSQDFRDAWFVGYTAHLTAGIWLGNDDGGPMRKVSGGSLPAAIWHRVMAAAHQSLPPLPLPGTARPAGRTTPLRPPAIARAQLSPLPAVALIETPPLPERAVREGVAARPSSPHPIASIPEDFLAGVLGETAEAANNRNASAIASRRPAPMPPAASGFDADAIRARIAAPQLAEPHRALPDASFMALGRGRETGQR